MRTLSFDRGVAQVADMLRNNKDTPAKVTAFLGAGVSIDAGIPSARGLIDKVREKYPTKFNSLSLDDQRRYGKVMSALALGERRMLIRNVIHDARMNWANIALAQLIAQEYFSRVLTVNFDPLLAEACRLVGCSPAIYDFGVAPVANVTAMATPAIVHLHGQSTGVVLLNTQKETDDHAKSVIPLLKHSIPHAPLVVAGYSGEADALLGRISSFCEEEHDIYWLDVSDEPPPHVARAFEGKKYVHYVANGFADRFFVEVAQKLDCFPPKFIADPLGHLLSEGERIVAFPRGSENETQDLLAVWRSDVQELQKIDHDRFSTRRNTINLSMAGDDKAAVQAARAAPADPQLTKVVDEARYWRLVREGNSALAEAHIAAVSEQDAKFRIATLAYRQALEVHPKGHEALNNWGTTLLRMAVRATDSATKDRLYDEACEKYAAALAIKSDMHEALNNWGDTLGRMGDFATDPVTKDRLYGEACEKFAAALAIKSDMHEALFNWGNTLGRMAERSTDAATKDRLYDETCEKYAQALEIKSDKHEALNNWGNALGRMAERATDAATKDRLYDEACEKYAAALAIKPDKYEALSSWGAILFRMASTTGSATTRVQLVKEAESKFRAAEAIKEGSASYNLACLLALEDRPDECREYLLKALKLNGQPDRQTFEMDPDLAKVRQLPWWPDILALAK